MLITETYLSDQSGSGDVTYLAAEHSVSRRDTSFFTSMLEGSGSTSTISKQYVAPHLMVEASNQLSASMNRFVKLIRAPKKNFDLEQVHSFPRDLFNAQLTPMVLVKCLAKTTQCVDKICNMQS